MGDLSYTVEEAVEAVDGRSVRLFGENWRITEDSGEEIRPGDIVEVTIDENGKQTGRVRGSTLEPGK